MFSIEGQIQLLFRGEQMDDRDSLRPAMPTGRGYATGSRSRTGGTWPTAASWTSSEVVEPDHLGDPPALKPVDQLLVWLRTAYDLQQYAAYRKQPAHFVDRQTQAFHHLTSTTQDCINQIIAAPARRQAERRSCMARSARRPWISMMRVRTSAPPADQREALATRARCGAPRRGEQSRTDRPRCRPHPLRRGR